MQILITGAPTLLSRIRMACGGSGCIKAKRKAKQFNGPDIDYDEVKIPCPTCDGTGLMSSSSTAPRSRRTE